MGTSADVGNFDRMILLDAFGSAGLSVLRFVSPADSLWVGPSSLREFV